MIRILALGDIVGARTLEVLRAKLWKKRAELSADFVIANGENTSEIHGLNAKDAGALLDCGVDLITLGNHAFGMRDLYDYLDGHPESIVRPANYPASCPGCGYTIREVCGYRVLCMNVNGTVFMEPLDSPFDAVEKILRREEGKYDLSLLDIHAEATSEKIAIARAFDGKISAMFGTHTHVATADARVLPGGSGYITDLGMSGPEDGVLGTRTDAVLTKLRSHMPAHFTVAEGEIVLRGALISLDPGTGFCRGIERVTF